MLTVEGFQKAARGAEPAATFNVLTLMRRARDIAIHKHWSGRSRVKSAEVLTAMHAVFPEVWQAWRAWAGPGSERIDFETFKPCHHAVLEGFVSVITRDHAEHIPVASLVEHMMTEYRPHYAAWCSDDPDCIVRALRRHANADVIAFDGLNLRFGDTADALQWRLDYSEAYRVEGARLMAEAEALEQVRGWRHGRMT